MSLLTKIFTPGFISAIGATQSYLVSDWSNIKIRTVDSIIVFFLGKNINKFVPKFENDLYILCQFLNYTADLQDIAYLLSNIYAYF